MALLVNGETESGGDQFAYLFKQRGIGPLVGTRTKSAMSGVGGVRVPFIDGGLADLPNAGYYDQQGS